MEIQNGLLVNVFKTNYDATNNGITSKNDILVLVGSKDVEVSKVFNEIPDRTLVLLSKTVNDDNYLYAEPKYLTDEQKKMNGPMFGGNFVYTSDSRFPNKYPIPVHDRFEEVR